MNKKAVHFGFFMRTISDNLKIGSNNRTKAMFLTELEKEYPPSAGWEVTQAFYTGQNPEGYTVGLVLTQYENV